MPYLPSDEEIQEIMNCRNLFIDRWRGLIRTKIVDEFNSAWEKLKGYYGDQPGLIRYLKAEWIPRRFEWAMPWTLSITHFRNTSTSRLEGTHRDVKHYIGGPSNDFQVILERIENYIIKEVHRFDADLANDRIRPPHAVVAPACPITTPILIEKVSNAALLLLAKQYKLAIGQHNPICTGNFTRLYGIPCCHLIKAILDYSQFKFIELKDIDPHWHYKRPTEEDLSTGTSHDILLRIRAPEMARQRQGRQELNARRATDHTAREPYAWEGQQILEQAQITRGRARGQWGRPRGSRRGGTQRGGGEQGSQAQAGPPATPARSPSTDLADYFDALESPDILHLIEQDTAVTGASTPSGTSRSNTTRRGRGRPRGRGRGRAAVAAASVN